ncbi:MAG: GNAT family N-acetyltransferase [Planctomycetota bacterium]|jgi:ribosomal-protein-alanine N-acetyltransferase
MSIVVCEGEKVFLREAEGKDAKRLSRWKQDSLLRSMALSMSSVYSLAEEQADIEKAVASENQEYLIIVRKEESVPIGYVRINWMDSEKRFAWLRFAIGESDARRRGFCKDALRAFITHLFGQGMHRIEAEAYEKNTASISLLESLGFSREGIKREAHFNGEAYFDIMAFGLLKGELR